MVTIDHPHFGHVEIAGSTTQLSTTLGGQLVHVDLNVEAGTDSAAIMRALDRAAGLPDLDAAARAAIRLDADEGGSASLYVEHHLSELEPKDLVSLFAPRDPAEISQELFLSKMRLIRAGLYPASPRGRLVLDYSVDPELTQYLLAVTLDANGRVCAIDMES